MEFDNHVGIIRVIAKSPIRTRDEGVEENVIKAYRVDSSPSEMLSFASFGGYHSVRERAVELIETQLERRDLLATIGARPIKGIIFSGPPGTGKTHLARIIAHESGAAFYLVSGPSIVSKWVGDSEDTLRRIFADAASEAKAIVFFDEIDSIAESRTGESHESSKRLVAQLLTLLDGFDREGSNVVVLAATNRIDDVDDALLRPGRFDWEIPFGLPTFEDRLEILQVSSRNLRTDQALPLDEIARLTEGWPPARLTSIWTEAALVAAGDGRPQIADEDLLIALERVSNRPARTRGVEEA
ncbi:MAG: ATP-binding protein [Ornithinimicrobium sp.]